MTRDEIEKEVDRLVESLPSKRGGREHLLASLLHSAGIEVDVTCPECGDTLTVTDYPMKNGHSIRCSCGLCSGDMKGL